MPIRPSRGRTSQTPQYALPEVAHGHSRELVAARLELHALQLLARAALALEPLRGRRVQVLRTCGELVAERSSSPRSSSDGPLAAAD